MRVPALEPHAPAPEPLPGSPLDVVVAGGWRLPVRCRAAAEPGDVHLRPVSEATAMPGGVEVCPASLEWRSARGLVRRTGLLRAGTGGIDLVLTEASDAVVMQRRNFARVRVAVRVRVSLSGGELLTQTVDLSVGGMLVEQSSVLQIGDGITFSLAMPTGIPLTGSGSVVRSTPYGHRAIEFDELSMADEQRLARYVMEQEREGRSAAAYSGA